MGGPWAGIVQPSMEATASHRAAAPDSVRAVVLTVSDTRTPETDTSGDFLVEALAAAGHDLRARGIVRDEPQALRDALTGWIVDPAVQVVLTTGGTGITRRDGTVDVVEALLDTPLPGFGELFRQLSYGEVGAAAILSRATAGVAGRTLLFTLPGSVNAVQTAWRGILEPELSHLVFELLR
jgi:molybdenum cofactor biosynthesis protein B